MKILFLHGWMSHTYRWKRYIESFDANQFTLYSIDGLAHGLSEGTYFNVALYGALIQAFMDRFGMMDVVIGHSMGCFSALNAFYANPSIVPKAAVLLASPDEAKVFFKNFKNRAGLTNRTSIILDQYFKDTYHESVEDFSAPRYASVLTIPGLLIHDVEDDDTHVTCSRNIHDRWKNSKLLETHGLGHNLRSEIVVDLVHEFVMLQRPAIV